MVDRLVLVPAAPARPVFEQNLAWIQLRLVLNVALERALSRYKPTTAATTRETVKQLLVSKCPK